MELSENLVREFSSLLNGKQNKKSKKETTFYGTAHKTVSQGVASITVTLDGAPNETATPAATLVEVEDGDRVMVSMKNHSVVIIGNITNPSFTRLGNVYMVMTQNGLKVGGIGENEQPEGAYILIGSSTIALYETVQNGNDRLLARFGASIQLGRNDKPRTLIDSDSLDIVDANGNVLATFTGSSIQLGRNNKPRTVIDNDSLDIVDANGNVLATFTGSSIQLGPSNKAHVVVDGSNLIFYDKNNKEVGSFQTDLASFGRSGTSRLQITESSLALWGKNGANMVGRLWLSSNTADTPTCNFEINGTAEASKFNAGQFNAGRACMIESDAGNAGVYDSDMRSWLIYSDQYGNVRLYSYIGNNITIDRAYGNDSASSAIMKLFPGIGDQEYGKGVSLMANSNGNRGVAYYSDDPDSSGSWLVYRGNDEQTYVPGFCTRTVHSNTTNEYIATQKYSDGRLVTDMRVRLSCNFNTAWGGLYYNGTALTMPNFPVTYVGTPVVVANVRHVSGNSIAMLMSQNTASTTNPGSVYACKSGSGTTTIEITVHAEGMWK